MDPWGDHAITCSKDGDRAVKHNNVRDALIRECQRAGFSVQVEAPGLIPNSQVRPGDFVVRNYKRHQDWAFDLVITSRLQAGS